MVVLCPASITPACMQAIDFAELFAGHANLAREFAAVGQKVAASMGLAWT